MSTSHTLSAVLDAGDVGIALAWMLGRSALPQFRAACQAGARCAVDSLPALRVGCPPWLYVCGGYSGLTRLNSAERFDPGTGIWEQLPHMLQQRAGPAVASFHGELYVIGASCSDGNDSAERFRPALGKWEVMPRLLKGRERAAAVSLGGWLYLCGGTADETQPFSALSSMERFCVHRPGNFWESLPSMKEPRDNHAAASLGGYLYVCGGDGVLFQPLQTVERYHAETRCWEQVQPMLERRSGAAAVALGGWVYVCGGSNGTQELRSMERFDPSTGIWADMPAMLWPRFGPAAAALDGKIYVCGGATNGQQLQSVERFDPDTGIWENVSPMQIPRVRAAATAVVR